MMKKPVKKQPVKTRVDQLFEKKEQLEKKLLQAYQAGMSDNIIAQIQMMIEQISEEMYVQSELAKAKAQRKSDKDDGSIV